MQSFFISRCVLPLPGQPHSHGLLQAAPAGRRIAADRRQERHLQHQHRRTRGKQGTGMYVVHERSNDKVLGHV